MANKSLRRSLPEVNNIAADLFDAGDFGKTKSMTATLKYANSSEKKMELVAKLIRGKKVEDAMLVLSYTPKKAAKILLKVLKSAIANATNNLGLNEKDLIVSRIDIGRGPKIKRYRFVSRGRVHSYVRRRAFVRVVLDIK